MKTIYIKQTIGGYSKNKDTIHYEVVEHNGKKFLIYINADASTPCGFNTHCCLSVMTPDGTWNRVVDNKQIDAPFPQDELYYGSVHDKVRETLLTETAKPFKDYIQTIY